MFCNKCGAGLRDYDRFCAQCGAPVEEHRRTEKEPEIFYDEKLYRDDKPLYRDTFLTKTEEKSHALLVTVTLLLVMAVLVAAVLVLVFFFRRSQLNDSNEQAGVVYETETEGSVILYTELTPEETETEPAAVIPVTEVPVETEVHTEPQTEAADRTKGPDLDRIQEILDTESTVTRSAYFIYDLDHFKEYASQSSNEPMYASALISIPILYTAAAKLDTREVTLNDMITYVNSIGGRGEAYPEEKDGQQFPLSYYLMTMMSYSDNNCMNCLIDYFGLDAINETCHNAGYTSVDLQRKIVEEVTDGKDNYLSAADMAGMVKDLYQGKFQTISREFVKKYLKIDEGDGFRTLIGLAESIPYGSEFLNQNGRGDTRYNEVAVISNDSCQYLVSIMLNGEYGYEYENAVIDVSDYIYQSLQEDQNM